MPLTYPCILFVSFFFIVPRVGAGSHRGERRGMVPLTTRRRWASAITITLAVGSSESFLLTPGKAPFNSYGHSAARSTSTTTAEGASAVFTPTPANPQRIPGGQLLSLDFDDLANVLEGSGRAKMVWAALSQGVDPFSEAAATEFLTDKTAAVLSQNFQELPWEVSYIRAASLTSFTSSVLPDCGVTPGREAWVTSGGTPAAAVAVCLHMFTDPSTCHLSHPTARARQEPHSEYTHKETLTIVSRARNQGTSTQPNMQRQVDIDTLAGNHLGCTTCVILVHMYDIAQPPLR